MMAWHLLRVALCGAAAAAAAVPERLTVRGGSIYEPNSSTPVLLRGFNLDYKLGSDCELPSAEDRALAALAPGANLVRLVMNHWHDTASTSDCSTQEGPDYVSSACLEQFDATLKWSTGELGAWSIVTARSALAAGDGGPGGTIFTNATLKAQWLAMWGALAKRYASLGRVAGYEVMSEPRTAAAASVVHGMQQEACDAVWAHDPRACCLVGASEFYNRYNLNATYLIEGGPVIYAANFFEPKVWVNSQGSNNQLYHYGGDFPCTAVTYKPYIKERCGGFHSNTTVRVDRAWLAAELGMLTDFARRHEVPVWIDQWGLQAGDPGGAAVQGQYLDDVLAEFAARGFHWTYWIWRRTKAWGQAGYAIERQAPNGSYSVFELCLGHLKTAIGGLHTS